MPVETIGSSPAQRLMSPRTKTLMPTATTLLHLRVAEGVEKKIELKRQQAKSYYDRSAHPLPQLEAGQEVRVAPTVGIRYCPESALRSCQRTVC